MSRLEDAWFEALYAKSLDPWEFETSWYEERKRALTMAALPERRYRSAFEPGCALGLLTVELARRCDELLSTDPVAAMVEQARSRIAGQGPVGAGAAAVVVQRGAIPEDWPRPGDGAFDLIVLSEVAYYLDGTALEEVVGLVDDSLVAGGDLVAVHWTGETDYPSSADQVHAALGAAPGLAHQASHRDAAFRIDVWRHR